MAIAFPQLRRPCAGASDFCESLGRAFRPCKDARNGLRHLPKWGESDFAFPPSGLLHCTRAAGGDRIETLNENWFDFIESHPR